LGILTTYLLGFNPQRHSEFAYSVRIFATFKKVIKSAI